MPGPTAGKFPDFEGVELHNIDDTAVTADSQVVRVLQTSGNIPTTCNTVIQSTRQ